MNRSKCSPHRIFQTILIALLAALATVSIGAYAQQHGGNKSADSQKHPPGANYWHRVRPPDLNLPQIPGIGPGGGRPNFGGCDAADVTIGTPGCGSNSPSQQPVCTDPNAINRRQPPPCVCKDGFKWNGSMCVDNTCRDSNALNFGKALPCIREFCMEPEASNYGEPLPCLCPGGEPMVNGKCYPGDPRPPGVVDFNLSKTYFQWDVVSDTSYWGQPADVLLRLGLATNEWAVMYGYEGKDHAEQGTWYSGSSKNVEYRVICSGHCSGVVTGIWTPMTAREIRFAVTADASKHLDATIEFRNALTHANLGQIYIDLTATSK